MGGSQSGITVQHALHRTATAAGLTSLWLFVLCVCFNIVGWLDAAVLVNPLEALRVLHSQEEFLPQVLERFIGGKVQAVETGRENIY